MQRSKERRTDGGRWVCEWRVDRWRHWRWLVVGWKSQSSTRSPLTLLHKLRRLRRFCRCQWRHTRYDVTATKRQSSRVLSILRQVFRVCFNLLMLLACRTLLMQNLKVFVEEIPTDLLRSDLFLSLLVHPIMTTMHAVFASFCKILLFNYLLKLNLKMNLPAFD